MLLFLIAMMPAMSFRTGTKGICRKIKGYASKTPVGSIVEYVFPDPTDFIFIKSTVKPFPKTPQKISKHPKTILKCSQETPKGVCLYLLIRPFLLTKLEKERKS